MKFSSLQGCLQWLCNVISSQDKEVIRTIEEEEMGKYHFSVGMSLRNDLGLWKENSLTRWFNSIGIYHADDMSGIILKSLWRTLNNKSIDLEGQVNYYQNFWRIRGLSPKGEIIQHV